MELDILDIAEATRLCEATYGIQSGPCGIQSGPCGIQSGPCCNETDLQAIDAARTSVQTDSQAMSITNAQMTSVKHVTDSAQKIPKKKKALPVVQVCEPDRTMATIDTIVAKRVIMDDKGNEALNIELVTVRGWQVVAMKNDFEVGDLCVYVEIGSVFPTDFKKADFLEGQPLKSVLKLKTLSQGLVFKLDWLTEERGIDISSLAVGDDVTSIIGIKKWVEPEESELYEPDTQPTGSKAPQNNRTKIPFPNFIPKTDEPRIQNNKKFIEDIQNEQIFVSRKEDGCSATFVTAQADANWFWSFVNTIWLYIFGYCYKETKEFLVCSRNFGYRAETADSTKYFMIAERFRIKEKLEAYGKNHPCIAVQGEIIGPGINGNRLKLTDFDFRVFSIYNVADSCYFSQSEMVDICKELGLNTVPILYQGLASANEHFQSLESILSYTGSVQYNNGNPAEGIVVRVDKQSPRISFKVISNEFLLKHKK